MQVDPKVHVVIMQKGISILVLFNRERSGGKRDISVREIWEGERNQWGGDSKNPYLCYAGEDDEAQPGTVQSVFI